MKQSFLTQLGKGFIRSAVNQVGRDSGRVVSNQIYRTQHSTPIRIVADANTGNIEIPEGYHTKNEYTILKVIYAFFLSLIPFIGSIILIYRGIVNLCKKTRNLYKTEQHANYVQDRRCKSGARFVGNTGIEVVAGEIEDVKYQKACFVKGIFYIVIALGSLIFYTYSIFL